MPDMRLIINADDFGYDSVVNRAIVAGFSRGLCSSTTIMANMPGFEEACQLCYDNKLSNHVGLHLVLSEGRPLTDKIRRCLRFCDSEGFFDCVAYRHYFRLSREEKEAIAQEVCAQIDRCREHGIPLSHLDSHHHIHAEWGIASVCLRIARNKGLRYIRLARSRDPHSTWFKNLYRRFLNTRILLNGAAATQYFGTVEDFAHLRKEARMAESCFEVMIHPAFNEEQMLIDAITGEPLEQYVARIDNYRNAISYWHIAQRHVRHMKRTNGDS